MTLRSVAIFDAETAPAVAFVRSLGRAGVPTSAYSDRVHPIARFSKYVDEVRISPAAKATDRFVDWLATALQSGEIDLVAPTSDFIVFCVAEAHARLGSVADGHPTPHAVRTCLFKDWFHDQMTAASFPPPSTAMPTSAHLALEAAADLGYPLVIKPRTHIGVGVGPRGNIVYSRQQLEARFRPFDVDGNHATATVHNRALRWPLLQQFISNSDVDVISVSGCLDGDGQPMAIGHCRKLRSWPPGTGTGTMFEALPVQPFTDRAVAAVRDVLGRGLFELEVLVDRSSGQAWPIDLNPRAYGQISLEIARGNDLPALWYQLATGCLVVGSPPRRPPARRWVMAWPYYSGTIVGLVKGPARRKRLDELITTLRSPRVGATWDRDDIGPGIASLRPHLRRPHHLVMPFARDRSHSLTKRVHETEPAGS